MFIFYNKIFSVNHYAFFINHFKRAVYLLVVVIFFSSCFNAKKVAYFQDISDTSKTYSQVIKGTYEPKIQPDDVIGITVSSINPQATAVFNMGSATNQLIPGATTTAVNSANEYGAMVKGYLVNKQGFIDFPVLGDLHVEGVTTSQLKDSLKIKLDQYLKDPIVNVRLLNYKITVLGEVGRPSTYSIPSERITVVDAIGMAGDLTIYGKRENVLLIREENGKRDFVRLNLNSSKLFESPYYYLKQNDIIYVEPSKAKVDTLESTSLRRITVVASVISVIILAFYRLK